MTVSPVPLISQQEQQERLEATNFARASLALSNVKIDESGEEYTHRFVQGDLNLEEYVVAMNYLGYGGNEPAIE